MTEENNGNVDRNVDETLLLVSGSKGNKDDDKQYVKKLSNAILQVFEKHGAVKLRCVGAASLNNAIKSFIIAKGECKKKEESIFIDPSFTTVVFNGEEKTGIVLELVAD
jgi:stage V sporulation protein SpoVS